MRPIDADALKAKFCNHCDERDCKPDATDTVYGCVIADTIDSMPTIEVEPVKHGEWIFQGRRDEDGRNIYRCSGCNFEVGVFPCNFISWRTHEKYCPGCGARMDGDSK